MAPPVGDAACSDNMPRVILSNEFDHGRGLAGGFAAGYAAGPVRIEMEYLHRHHGDSTSPLGGTADPALSGKSTEWSADEPSYEWIGNYAAHQFFANAYYDFRNASNWTPYVGAGVGWAATGLSYYAQFVRKPEAEYLEVEFDPDWSAVAKRAAAGTASILDTKAETTVFGYQLLAGVDYALSQQTSIGLTVRQARFGDVQHDTFWNLIRSHAPVQADGEHAVRRRHRVRWHRVSGGDGVPEAPLLRFCAFVRWECDRNGCRARQTGAFTPVADAQAELVAPRTATVEALAASTSRRCPSSPDPTSYCRRFLLRSAKPSRPSVL